MGVMQISKLKNSSMKNEKFFVDTNVWIYQAYIANKGFELDNKIQQKLNIYSDFIQRIKQDGGILYTSPLCLSELGHHVEREAYNLYKKTDSRITSIKEFRSISSQRNIIVSDIENAWEDIKSLATILDYSITKQTGDESIIEIKKSPLDTYDAIFFLTMKKYKITNLISDDKDFHDISELDIYTA